MKYGAKRVTQALGLLAGLACVTQNERAYGQQSANVTVNAGSPLAVIPAQAFGVNTAVWDGNLLNAAVPNLLKQAGTTMLRFPGGSTADAYHWQNNSSTANSGQYINPANTFDAFMGVAQKTGAGAILTVNYGSNQAGTAGGDPAEAAAWVRYANITKGYGVKYWEIGNELYGNGEYGSAWETDLHSDHSPPAYGTNAAQFIAQMKAVDSSIKVGVVLTAPGAWPDGQSPDWNSGVLAACGSKIDFVIVHWYAQGPGSESDSALLASTSQIAGMVSKLRSLIAQYCGPNAANVQILVTESNSVAYNPGKQSVSLVNGLFLADDYMQWLENGVTNVDWWDLHNSIDAYNNNSGSLYGAANYGDYGLLSSGQASGNVSEPAVDTPFAPYYGLQMLTNLGKPGDQMVTASSSQSNLAVHAVKQANGSLALLLLNKDPSNTINASISVAGYTPASSATVYTYGQNSSAITSAARSGAGTSFTQTVAPYSLTTVVLSAGSGAPSPAFTSSATVAPATIAPGGASTIQARVTDTGGALANGIVDVEVYNSAGNRVGQQYFTGQNFAANQSQTYTYAWTAPAATGKYTVEIGVFGSGWTPNYAWNGNAATITVGSSDTAQYNFEAGTQGWATSGGMITGVSSSGTQAFAGAKSLAVQFGGSSGGTQQAYIASPTTPAGKTVTFHVWIPAGSAVTAVQPFVQQGASGNWLWTGNYQSISNLSVGTWNTLTVTVPANAATPLYQLGVQFFTSRAWNGVCYVDSVGW